MKRLAYANYEEFRTFRGSRVRKTEKAEITELNKSIQQLIEQKDYDSLDTLRKLAAALIPDPEDKAAQDAQYDIYNIASHITDKSMQHVGFISALVSKL